MNQQHESYSNLLFSDQQGWHTVELLCYEARLN